MREGGREGERGKKKEEGDKEYKREGEMNKE